MRPLLVYIDTSVFGGMFDPEFEEYTQLFFQEVNSGRFRLAVSRQVYDEIAPAPTKVKQLFDDSLRYIEYIEDSAEVQHLADLYVQSNIIGKNSIADALHVAYATVRICDGVVSWNYKHMVHPDKSVLFNVVNLMHGYGQLFIASPKEVVSYEKGF